jgi:cysteine desulfurase
MEPITARLTIPSKRPSIYMDHAATTPVDSRVLAAMTPYWSQEFGNPSATYRLGRTARTAIEQSRSEIASILGARADEIIFTGSGTESDNLAILGLARAAQGAGVAKRSHIVVSSIEHKAVLEAARLLEKYGFEVTRLKVDREGLVAVEDLRAAVRKDTLLVSVMYANNEVGTVQDIAALARVAHQAGALFHTDACQATGYLPLKVGQLEVDLMTLNASKAYGPKGVGLLYCKQGIQLDPMLVGGGQERGLRSGTENVAAIVGLAKTLELAETDRATETVRLTELRDYFMQKVVRLPDVVVNGHRLKRLPNNLHISIKGVEGESVVQYLDECGVFAATGSACDSKSFEPSHVLLALGLPYDLIGGSVRFTMGRTTTRADVDYVVERLSEIIAVLRELKQKVTASPTLSS